MEVGSELSRENSRRSALISQRLQELQKALPQHPGRSGLSLPQIAERLFARAPLELLEQHTSQELLEIIHTTASCVERVVTGEVAVDVHTARGRGCASIAIAVTDRPFVVNTVMECCREDGVRLRTLLHPVYDTNRGVVSASYIEIEDAEVERLQSLADKISSAIQSLLPVTDDYPKMQAHIRGIAEKLSMSGGPGSEEISAFASWLTEGHFNLFGSVVLEAQAGGLQIIDCAGLCSLKSDLAEELKAELKLDIASLTKNGQGIFVNSLLSTSPVHRRTRLTSISFAEPVEPGKRERFSAFVGLFTSKALTQECSSIPLIRQRFWQLVKAEGFAENSHDFKSVASIVDSLPKEAALGLALDAIRLIVNSVLGVATSSETVTSVWPDADGRGICILVVMTRTRFDARVKQSIEEYLAGVFNADPVTSEHHLDITNRPVVRLYFYVPTSTSTLKDIQVDDLRSSIAELARSWHEDLEIALTHKYRNGAVHKLLSNYGGAFSEEYRASQSIADCIDDIAQIETLSAQSPLQIAIANLDQDKPDAATIVVYGLGSEITISQAVPILENCGFLVINERSWKISPLHTPVVTSNRFRVRTRSGNPIDLNRFAQLLPPAMVRAFHEGRDNDILNTLLIEAGLDLRAVAGIRTYCRFLWQVKRFASRFSIYRTLANNPDLARQLWNIFEVLFDPKCKDSLEDRKRRAATESAALIESLRHVKDVTTDRIFRSMLALLENTVRTNFYLNLPYIALKFRSEAIDIMPHPRPMFEVFVNSPIVEGVHLRSGMVARGGLRWSDRPDDYRSEVLGLMKTQRIKNALIVPTGAKGGFIIKNTPTDPKQLPVAVREAYSEYIRALLSIADTMRDGRVVRAQEVLAYEGDDPYFVVAADKGTATFSDVANQIAVKEFSFWLNDAFASGGSNGYDHKKYGITAKGAWECVVRHFRDLGMDFERVPFTAVGIGDMAGDVFGNGMLLSRKLKLLAAFNHKHIFLDPSPDPERSFEERRRLFELKGSQWSDYQSSLISKGGGIFDRYAKEIPLGAEIREALGVTVDTPEVVSGDALISIILKAPVDLMWNGGIGTYVKSRQQSHAEVSDGANDAVRINADELRCKIIGEGGNLGLTQIARIEANRLGVSLNTDAIDNSGGVDLSDHEVNLKILFSRLLQDGKVSLEERNAILLEMANEVCEAVLNHNRSHALLLTHSAVGSRRGLQYYQGLLRDLVKHGYVNRALDNLPDDDELQDRHEEGAGLARPELAVCTATAKMWIKDVVLASDLLEERLLQPLLLEYFPQTMQKRWSAEVVAHPLARNILASQIANTLVDGMGITLLHQLSVQFGVPPVRVVECALVAELIFNTRAHRTALLALEPTIGTPLLLKLTNALGQSLVDAAGWFISRHGSAIRLPELVKRYDSAWRTLSGDMMPATLKERYQASRSEMMALGIDQEMASSLAVLPEVSTGLDLLWCAHQASASVVDAALVYGEVAAQLAVDQLLARCREAEARDRWEGELLIGTEQDIRGSVAELTMNMLSTKRISRDGVRAYLEQTIALDRWKMAVGDILQRAPEVASLAVLARQLQGFART